MARYPNYSFDEPTRGRRRAWLYRHRRPLTPVAVLAGVAVTGVLCALLLPLWPHTLVGVAAAAAGAWLLFGLLPDQLERVYGRAVTVVSAGWILALHRWGTERPRDFAVAAVIALALLGPPHLRSQRGRRKIEIENELESWPIVAGRIGLAKARISAVRRTATGRSWTLWWDRGDYTISGVKRMGEQLEGALGIPHGQLRFAVLRDGRGHAYSDRIEITENVESAARYAPVPFTQPSMTSITEPLLVGPYEDGQDATIVWFQRGYGGKHGLIAGMTGSGKSGLINLLLAESAAAADLVRWGMDFKGGMALRPWAPLFDWLVCDGSEIKEQAREMLSSLKAVMDERALYAARRGWDVWEPSADLPIIMLIIDEAAELLGMSTANFNALELVESIGRMGRATGVVIILATQYPTNEAVGSSQVKSQIGLRMCFRVERAAHQHVIMSNSHEVDATFPDKPADADGAGWAFLSVAGSMRPVPLRVRYIGREDRDRVVAGNWEYVPTLNPSSTKAAGQAYAERHVWTLGDLGGDHRDDERDNQRDHERDSDRDESRVHTDEEADTVTPLPYPRDVPLDDILAPQSPEAEAELLAAQQAWQDEHAEYSPDRARAELINALTLAGPSGVRTKKLVDLCHRSPSWVHERLVELRTAQHIQSPSHGFWAFTDEGRAALSAVSSTVQ